ncbi:MAG: hypothetical protein IPO21_10540 [Bacteroidales bacterium]|nr:hypothetical protein [Bacteroidales bacterium]
MKIKIILLFLLSCIITIHSQSLKFDYIGAAHNMNDKFIVCVLEDNEKYIWLGTYSGLYRFDGNTCKNYLTIADDSTSLGDNSIYSMQLDRHGKLWIGHRFNGLSIYNHEKDNFKQIIIPDADKNRKVAKNSIRRIFLDRGNTLWIATTFGIARYDEATDSFIWYEKSLKGKDITNINGQAIAQSTDGKIWVGNFNSETLLVYDSLKNGFDEYVIKRMLGKSFGVATLDFDNKGYLWIGTPKAGLLRLNVETDEVKQFVNTFGNNTTLGSNEICSFLQDSKGQIWVGTINGGLCKYDAEKETFKSYKINEEDKFSLRSNSVSAIVENSEGDLLLGTHSGGLNILNYRKNKFKYLGKNGAPNLSLKNERSVCFYQDSSGIMWIGTDGVVCINLIV